MKGRVKLEKGILKPIIKGSKLKHSENEIREFVLFPYKKINGKHTIIPEKELKEKFPLAYEYLLSVKSELDKRDNGKPNFVFYSNPECTFYSGYCIKKINGFGIEKLMIQLNSDRMDRFVSMSSRNFRGGWKAYNKKIIENYEIIP